MEIQSLIRLAHQADLEGNYRVADKLTERAIREAQFLKNIGRNIGDFFGNMNVGRGGRDIANQSLNIGTGAAGDAFGGGGGAGGRGGDVIGDVLQEATGGSATVKAKTPRQKKTPATTTATPPAGGTTPPAGTTTPPAGTTTPPAGGTTPPAVPPTGGTSRPPRALPERGPGGRFKAKGGDAGNTNAPATGGGGAGGAGGGARGGDSGISGGINKQDRFKSHNITGITGPAAMGLTAITAALGAYGMYLMNGKVVDQRGNPVPPDRIPDDIKSRIPQFQMMTRREEAGQISGGKALNAQNFIDLNSSNPRLKNQRDWYNLALQTSGGDKNFANNVISFVKASPEMPSQVGGGPNI
jgi:hypothetical protein